MPSTKADQRLLRQSVISGNRHGLHQAILKKADVDTRSTLENTSSHIAALQGDFHAVKKLVQAGADVSLRNRWGQTPLDAARDSAKLDPFAGENGKLLALLSPGIAEKQHYKDALQSAESGDWVAQHSPFKRHTKRREAGPSWKRAPRAKPGKRELVPLGPADLRRAQIRRQQTTLVDHQGLRDRNPRYPACARELRRKRIPGDKVHHPEEYHLELPSVSHAPPDWPHKCDVRQVKKMPRANRKGRHVNRNKYDIDVDCSSGQGYAIAGSAFCRAHGGRTGETW